MNLQLSESAIEASDETACVTIKFISTFWLFYSMELTNGGDTSGITQ